MAPSSRIEIGQPVTSRIPFASAIRLGGSLAAGISPSICSAPVSQATALRLYPIPVAKSSFGLPKLPRGPIQITRKSQTSAFSTTSFHPRFSTIGQIRDHGYLNEETHPTSGYRSLRRDCHRASNSVRPEQYTDAQRNPSWSSRNGKSGGGFAPEG